MFLQNSNNSLKNTASCAARCSGNRPSLSPSIKKLAVPIMHLTSCTLVMQVGYISSRPCKPLRSLLCCLWCFRKFSYIVILPPAHEFWKFAHEVFQNYWAAHAVRTTSSYPPLAISTTLQLELGQFEKMLASGTVTGGMTCVLLSSWTQTVSSQSDGPGDQHRPTSLRANHILQNSQPI